MKTNSIAGRNRNYRRRAARHRSRPPDMATPARSGRRGDLEGLAGRQNTPPPDPKQERIAAEERLKDACRDLLATGLQPGFISIIFGRIMAALAEADHE